MSGLLKATGLIILREVLGGRATKGKYLQGNTWHPADSVRLR